MIKKLPQEVINKIAAGEIVQRPYSVVKEVIENSLDAGATNISVYLKNAGLDEIKICDNGSGIMEEDLPLLCERYATSKIQQADDLKSLHSFGFRGEALASISFVSDITVITKRKDKEIGVKATFRNQKLLSKELIACSDGTEITINSLFDNLEKRREALNKSEEKKIVLQLLQSLSVHHDQVKIKLYYDKHNEFSSFNSRLEAIASITDIKIQSLQQTTLTSDLYKFNANLMFTKLSSLKYRRDFCLFINDRYVECDTLKRKVIQVYQECYLSIHSNDGGFYVYLSLQLEPSNIDPNVHPNKKLIKFVHEYEIGNEIADHLKSLLGNTNTQKMIQTQIRSNSPVEQRQSFKRSFQSQYQKEKIRNDPLVQTLDQFIQPQSQRPSFASQRPSQLEKFLNSSQIVITPDKEQEQQKQIKMSQIISQEDQLRCFNISEKTKVELFELLQSKHDNETKQFYQRICFVGQQSDRQQLLVQNDTALYHFNVVPMLFNMFLFQIAQGKQLYGCEAIEIQFDKTINLIFQYENQIQLALPDNEKKAAIQVAEELSLIKYDKEFIRDIVLPYFKKNQVPTIKIQYKQVVCLEDLYKNFERCG